MDKPNLIIVGAGAAGLLAARELASIYSITILEANARIGGRIYSVPSFFSSKPIEGGAEFVHGHCKLTLQLLKEAGIKYEVSDGKMFRHKKDHWEEQSEMIEGWKILLRKMNKLDGDYSLDDFLHEYFSEPKYSNLRQQATHYAEGFDLADTKKVSMQYLYKEWSNEEDQFFRIPSGYGSIIKYLQKECEAKGVKVFTNKKVQHIEWKKHDLMIFTNDGQHYFANKCIVTVPIRCLADEKQDGYITFKPALDQQQKAAKGIGFGNVIKVTMRFRERFWKDKIGFIISEAVFPVWWTQDPDPALLLTGWIGGPPADELSTNSDDELLKKALASLASIFEMRIGELEELLVEKNVFNWKNIPFAGGGYSYCMVGSAAARETLCTPVDDTIFFAGEAIYDGKSPGTVEAALASGKDVAKKLS